MSSTASLTGSPPQDLALSNLAVQQTVVSATLSAVNVSAGTVNGISTATDNWPILSIFNNLKLGYVTLANSLLTFTLQSVLNQSGGPLPADSVFAYIPGWPYKMTVDIPTFVYCPDAPTIATAGFSAKTTLHSDGTLSVNAALAQKDPGTGIRIVPTVRESPQ